jgi:hypothetical protein
MARKPRPPRESDRVTYRDLRNTPGRVWERLASNEVLTLVAEGEAKALLVPVEGGDVRAAYEAYARGRAMLAAARLRRSAREAGADTLSLGDINALIRKSRDERRRRARDK